MRMSYYTCELFNRGISSKTTSSQILSVANAYFSPGRADVNAIVFPSSVVPAFSRIIGENPLPDFANTKGFSFT